MIGLSHYLVISAALFSLGIMGVLTRKNAVNVLMGIELILNSANINLVAFARYSNPPILTGWNIVFFSIAAAAMEATVGLALILVAFRLNGTIDLRKLNRLRG